MPDDERDFVEVLESVMQGAVRESGQEVDDSFLFSIWSTQEAKQIQFMGVLLSACNNTPLAPQAHDNVIFGFYLGKFQSNNN